MSKKLPEKQSEIFAKFMKKQAISASSNHSDKKKSSPSLLNFNKEDNEELAETYESEEEKAKKKELAEAKKASISKAVDREKGMMIRRLILQSIAKYLLLIFLLVGFALFAINVAPAIIKFFHGLLNHLFMSSLK